MYQIESKNDIQIEGICIKKKMNLSSILFLSMRGCLIHWLTNRCPCGVRHLFKRPARECVPVASSEDPWEIIEEERIRTHNNRHWTNCIFLVFEWPLTWKRFRACTAALSRRMYLLRSKVVILKEPKLASSERSSRYLMTACKQDIAIWKKAMTWLILLGKNLELHMSKLCCSAPNLFLHLWKCSTGHSLSLTGLQ